MSAMKRIAEELAIEWEWFNTNPHQADEGYYHREAGGMFLRLHPRDNGATLHGYNLDTDRGYSSATTVHYDRLEAAVLDVMGKLVPA